MPKSGKRKEPKTESKLNSILKIPHIPELIPGVMSSKDFDALLQYASHNFGRKFCRRAEIWIRFWSKPDPTVSIDIAQSRSFPWTHKADTHFRNFVVGHTRLSWLDKKEKS